MSIIRLSFPHPKISGFAFSVSLTFPPNKVLSGHMGLFGILRWRIRNKEVGVYRIKGEELKIVEEI